VGDSYECQKLSQKLRGHFAYYGITDNIEISLVGGWYLASLDVATTSRWVSGLGKVQSAAGAFHACATGGDPLCVASRSEFVT
jgi:hypothetical protein